MSRWTRGRLLGLPALGWCGLAVLAALGWLAMAQPWTRNAEGRQPRDEFAADRLPGLHTLAFDPKRAMGYLEEVCKIGPRISGSEGMLKQQELIRKHLEGLGAKVGLQKFTARQTSRRQPVEMANLIASWHPERTRRVIVCCHYDTRPIADQEPDRRKWTQPFVGANDGGSGVALLMELGHHVKALKLQVGVDFVFFDGEEYIFEPGADKYFFGSEHFAAEYRRTRPKHRYLAAVLVDMIAGKDARFPMDRISWMMAGELAQQVWRIAAEVGATAFVNDFARVEVQDDHVPLNRAGIPAIDIIDFEYPHWHRLTDVPENCSAESMEQVARVLGVWLQVMK